MIDPYRDLYETLISIRGEKKEIISSGNGHKATVYLTPLVSNGFAWLRSRWWGRRYRCRDRNGAAETPPELL